jgi:hypothetical protein
VRWITLALQRGRVRKATAYVQGLSYQKTHRQALFLMKILRTVQFGRVTLALLATIAVYGCTQREPSPATAASPAAEPSDANIVAATTPDSAAGPRDVVRAESPLGGVPTAYAAYFAAEQLQRITETRKPVGSDPASGEYIFYGARLTRYRGPALSGGSPIELNFDMQGTLTSSDPSAGNALSDAELDAIRNRAQLLRSVALARRSTQAHMTH